MKCEGSTLYVCPFTVVTHCGGCGAALCKMHEKNHTCVRFIGPTMTEAQEKEMRENSSNTRW